MSGTGPILGVNAFHGDSAACLVVDGRVVVAAEEERFRRIKHWAGFPTEAIAFCLDEGNLGVSDLAHIAVNREPRAQLLRKAAFTLRHRPSIDFLRERLRAAQGVTRLEDHFAERFPGEEVRAQIHNVEHHVAHLASAFHPSGFDEATVVSIDGVGDFSSAAWGRASGADVSVDGRVFFPHSLGLFYQALTVFLGFPNYGDEYKVMGLAPYGEPAYLDEMRRIVRLRRDGSFKLDLRYFVHHRETFGHEWRDTEPHPGPLYSDALRELLGAPRHPDAPLEQRHYDIARSVQAMYEEALFHLLGALAKDDTPPRLVLTGGCAQNSVANGKIHTRTPFEDVYIPPAGGDAGGAIGAAIHASVALDPESRTSLGHSAYLGPRYGTEDCRRALDAERRRLDAAGCTVRTLDETQLVERVVDALVEGNVVGWFQDRMEWGPRALGNRSILGDPRRADMKEILNVKIKRRESFRPFAPSVLREAVAEWFESDADVPFMAKVFPIREAKRALIPAVTHVDGTGRLQTVTEADNPRYYRLIKAFAERTGVPMILNTSFNESEPIVCRPEEALDCFLRTNMDLLVLGDVAVERHGDSQGP